MKMQLKTASLIVGGDFTETDMSIGDPRIIIHHLVKSVYQTPKITMVQEYACNARDANVEAGNGNIPIEIKVPNTLDPNLIISDHGIGINRGRMHEIFVKIGNSTKRGNNSEDGFFGIGSKIGFAYTPQFTVHTVYRDGDNLISSTYSCVQRDDYSLKLMELGEPHIVNSSDDACDQHTGTTITIPIKPDDFSEVRRAVLAKTEFWSVRPTLMGADEISLAYPKREWMLECPEFKFMIGHSHSGRAVTAIINGVQYEVKTSTYSNDGCVKIPSFYGEFFINFKVGELTPALNRESLQYDEKTCKLIQDRLHSAIAAVKNKIADIINDAPTYLSAFRKRSEFRSSGWTNNNFSWKGIAFIEQFIVPTVVGSNGVQCIPENAPVTFMTFDYGHNEKMRNKYENQTSIDTFVRLANDKLPIIYTEKKSISFKACKFLLNKLSNNHCRHIVFRGKVEEIKKLLTANHLEEVIPMLVCLDTCGYVPEKKVYGSKVVNKWEATDSWRGKMRTNGVFDFKDADDRGFYYTYDREAGDSALGLGNGNNLDRREMNRLVSVLRAKVCGVAPGNVKFLNKKHWKPLCKLLDNNEELHKNLVQFQEWSARKETSSADCMRLGIYCVIKMGELSSASPMRLWIEGVNAMGQHIMPTKCADIKNDAEIEAVMHSLVRVGVLPKITDESNKNPVIALHAAVLKAYPMLKYASRHNNDVNAKEMTDYIKMCDTAAGVV